MSVAGSPAAWIELLEKMLPDILRLVVESWHVLPRPFTDDREDAITKILCRALRDNRAVRELPFYVQIQMVELDPAPGLELGRLDIAFLPTGLPGAPSESVYLCLECKRLNTVRNGQRRPGGSEYVVHGMLRFVSGQYASAVRHGSMLGYVLDGDVSAAIGNVETNVRSQYIPLCMDAPGTLHPSSILMGLDHARESLHRRVHGPAPFWIHHLFMDVGGRQGQTASGESADVA
jgi:hypothetical protein